MKAPDFLLRPRPEPMAPTVSDQALWEKLRASDAVRQILADDEAKALAHRRELIKQIETAHVERAQREPQLIAARDAATKRREQAEREFRESIRAEQVAQGVLYHCGDLAEATCARLHRELTDTCNPLLVEFDRWLDEEVADIGHSMPGFDGTGYSAEALKGLFRRRTALSDLKRAVVSLKLRALSHDEVIKEIQSLLDTIPEMPSNVTNLAPRVHREIDPAKFARAGFPDSQVDQAQPRAALPAKIAAQAPKRERK